jgi:protein TonB
VQPQRQITIAREPVMAPTPHMRSGPAPTRPIPERANKVLASDTEVGKIPPPQLKPPDNPRPEVAANTSPAPKPPESVANPTGTIEIISEPYPTIRTPSNLKAPSSPAGTSLRIGHILTRVEPVYPPEAIRQRIAGIVKLHLLIGRDGTVQRVELLDGPAYLTEAARAAVQKWNFEPTLLGGAAVETEENISIVFRIANQTAAAN